MILCLSKMVLFQTEKALYWSETAFCRPETAYSTGLRGPSVGLKGEGPSVDLMALYKFLKVVCYLESRLLSCFGLIRSYFSRREPSARLIWSFVGLICPSADLKGSLLALKKLYVGLTGPSARPELTSNDLMDPLLAR